MVEINYLRSFLFFKWSTNKYMSLVTSKNIMNCRFKNWDLQVKMAEGTFTSNFIPSKNPSKTTIESWLFFF